MPAGGYGYRGSGYYGGAPHGYYGGAWRGGYGYGWGYRPYYPYWRAGWGWGGWGWGGWGWGVGWYPGWYGYGPGYWGWSAGAPVVVDPSASGAWVLPQSASGGYIEKDAEHGAPSSGPPQQWWYWCESARAYYPYVESCAQGWQRVEPRVPPSR